MCTNIQWQIHKTQGRDRQSKFSKARLRVSLAGKQFTHWHVYFASRYLPAGVILLTERCIEQMNFHAQTTFSAANC